MIGFWEGPKYSDLSFLTNTVEYIIFLIYLLQEWSNLSSKSNFKVNN